jgi:hypothetical protein
MSGGYMGHLIRVYHFQHIYTVFIACFPELFDCFGVDVETSGFVDEVDDG